ncbi:hypothetical protein DERP_010963 [Dermatophagoides pteronyssinus]|uniref:Uncharacterized protein n=1 Tax=Dermatophagoides pteronyssinus TaxID=6956 RepID=A0ABQ8JUV3_DERPT|nr:hypothetical protein DERP_010963 [Dermatophagoides pteronyssinus]
MKLLFKENIRINTIVILIAYFIPNKIQQSSNLTKPTTILNERNNRFEINRLFDIRFYSR